MKKVNEIMSTDVACTTPDTSLVEVSKLMVSANCGEIPIVSDLTKKNIVGVVTDRDIVCRTLGIGKNPMTLKAKDCMSKDVITVDPEANVDECLELMRENKIRRIPVVDKNNFLCGIVSQADLIKYGNKQDAIQTIQKVSSPGQSPSALQ